MNFSTCCYVVVSLLIYVYVCVCVCVAYRTKYIYTTRIADCLLKPYGTQRLKIISWSLGESLYGRKARCKASTCTQKRLEHSHVPSGIQSKITVAELSADYMAAVIHYTHRL